MSRLRNLKVKAGDLVEVYNDNGSTQAMVYPTATARRKQTFMQFANVLSSTIWQGAALENGVCGRETCLDCRQTLLQLHELVCWKVPGATGRNPAGALKQACTKIGVRCAACDVAIGAHQPQ